MQQQLNVKIIKEPSFDLNANEPHFLYIILALLLKLVNTIHKMNLR
jgi:capsule polysaccharide export protein KpsE/RkpR